MVMTFRWPNINLKTGNESFFRVVGSRFNDFMMCVLLDKPKHLRLTNFMAMQSFIAAELLQYKNPYPYIDGLLLRATRKIAEVPCRTGNV